MERFIPCKKEITMNEAMQEHWNKIYSENDERDLSWYQDNALPSLKLLAKASIAKDELILDIGSGTSVFISNLLDAGYKNIVAADISEVALNKSKEKLGKEKSMNVSFIVDDIAHSTKVNNLSNVAVWHDRVVFHFLTKSGEHKSYLETLNKVLKIGGYVIIATFSMDGPKRCSGLDVINYNAETLEKFFGQGYELKGSFNYKHHTQSGKERPFVYVLFNRKK